MFFWVSFVKINKLLMFALSTLIVSGNLHATQEDSNYKNGEGTTYLLFCHDEIMNDDNNSINNNKNDQGIGDSKQTLENNETNKVYNNINKIESTVQMNLTGSKSQNHNNNINKIESVAQINFNGATVPNCNTMMHCIWNPFNVITSNQFEIHALSQIARIINEQTDMHKQINKIMNKVNQLYYKKIPDCKRDIESVKKATRKLWLENHKTYDNHNNENNNNKNNSENI